MDRLSIIDPNNPANDISGGSSNFSSIVWYFQEAYKTLTERMAELSAEDEGKPNKDTECAGYNTILAPLFAGNYSSFQKQRVWLKHLSESGLPDTEDNRDLYDRVSW
jgi:non-canonical poly(A) RNA polymerase PAPD5/7